MAKNRYGLTPKQQKFCDAYVGGANFNATRAAIMAGYSERSAASIGWENLRKPEIKAYLQKQIMPKSEVMSRISQIASGSLLDVVDDNGQLNIEKARKSGKGRLIKKLQVTVNPKKGTIKYDYETHPPLPALRMLGQFHKLFTQKLEVSTSAADLKEIQDDLDIEMMAMAKELAAQNKTDVDTEYQFLKTQFADFQNTLEDEVNSMMDE